jgi:hypothetical protein
MQSLAGALAFVTKALPAGRAFAVGFMAPCQRLKNPIII